MKTNFNYTIMKLSPLYLNSFMGCETRTERNEFVSAFKTYRKVEGKAN